MDIDRELINDISDSIVRIEEIIAGVGFHEFSVDRKRKIAVVKELGNIIERTARISITFKEQNPDEIWDYLLMLRQRFDSSELGVDDEKLWDISKKKLKEIQNFMKIL